MSRWKSCNILKATPTGYTLWHFEVTHGEPKLVTYLQIEQQTPLPTSLVSKNWRSLLSPRLNIAWLPSDSIYLRILQLPQVSNEELHSMVELQIEKLSPIPPSQALWAFYPLSLKPSADSEKIQPVVVLIAEREAIETQIITLEEKGYLADSLEVPVIDLIELTKPEGNVVCIYPEATLFAGAVVLAWWSDSTLKHINTIQLPSTENRVTVFKHLFLQTLTAGTLEGIFKTPEKIKLVVPKEQTDQWLALIKEAAPLPIETVEAPSSEQLALATAKRVIRTSAPSTLMPKEFAIRYRQQLIDSLWMRSLGALVSAYAVFVLIYGAALQVLRWQTDKVQSELRALNQAYTNALRLEARLNVLREREQLKFAALDCWKTIVELLPEEATLQAFDFTEGRRLRIDGTIPADQVSKVLDFNEAVRKVERDGKPMFKNFSEFNSRTDPNNVTASWNFSCELNLASE